VPAAAKFVAKRNKKGNNVPITKGSSAPCHPHRSIWARGRCKSCYDKWLREHNPEYAARQKANCAGWAKKNHEWINKYHRDARANRSPEFKRARCLRKYGMTIADYDRLLAKQHGACAICRRPPKSGKPLNVDHCHTTGVVRGLLCFRCNYGLSYFAEDGVRLQRAANYLRRKRKVP
jgi:hypothetical protein